MERTSRAPQAKTNGQLESREATKDELKLVHTDDYISAMESTQNMSLEELEQFSSAYEDIYVNNSTWHCALLSAGCALLATEKVLDNSGSNAFAAIRPPGHHAWSDQACGFCIFNNVALCAKAARQRGVERVLIVDFDVHAAQGTQYCIDGDPGIRLISIHRYENGSFWPWLPESAARSEYTNTYNIPLHETGYGNAEYAAFMNHFVLPLIHDYKPELLLASSGFDAALYDPEGEMRVTPKGFAYMAGSLASLDIPLCALLEGGYFVEASGDLASATLGALIERKPPKIKLHVPSPKFVEALLSATALYQGEFPLQRRWICIVNSIRTASGKGVVEEPSDEYKGTRECTFPYPTRGVYDKRPKEVDKEFEKDFRKVVNDETSYMPSVCT
ncbi:histone deacetylase [Aphelenchoides avenae]|nr:histone deacetylase [Aphelenchus avenae]